MMDGGGGGGDDDDDLWTCLGTGPGYLFHLNQNSIYLICSLFNNTF